MRIVFHNLRKLYFAVFCLRKSDGVQPFTARKRREMLFVSGSSSFAAISDMESFVSISILANMFILTIVIYW